jgi:two-component system, cell cycle response regulator
MESYQAETYSVLVVEDDPNYRTLLKHSLESGGYRVTCTENGVQALECLRREFYPMVITDWMRPEMNGLELCHAIRAQAFQGYIFVMILSALGSVDDIVSGLDAGADEYLTKPFNPAELIARLNTGKRILALERSLKEAYQRIQVLSITDPLTGIYNRGYIASRFPEEIARARRYKRPLSVVMCDIDHFKRVNDSHGHQVGDKVLASFASCLKRMIRPQIDWIVRYGGEEFLIFLPETGVAGADTMAERARQVVEASSTTLEDGSDLKITASFGVAGFDSTPREGVTSDFLIGQADERLYQAKNQGRNRVVSGPSLEKRAD